MWFDMTFLGNNSRKLHEGRVCLVFIIDSISERFLLFIPNRIMLWFFKFIFNPNLDWSIQRDVRYSNILKKNPQILHIDIVSLHNTCVMILQWKSKEEFQECYWGIRTWKEILGKLNQAILFYMLLDLGKMQQNIQNYKTLFGENVFSIRNQWWFWRQLRKPVLVLKDIHWPCWHSVIAIHQENKNFTH